MNLHRSNYAINIEFEQALDLYECKIDSGFIIIFYFYDE